MTAARPLIKVTGLTMGWDSVVLQRDASFEVPREDIFVILGASGCGKSTMLRHLIGLEAPLAPLLAALRACRPILVRRSAGFDAPQRIT